jgi:hypothetical protein
MIMAREGAYRVGLWRYLVPAWRGVNLAVAYGTFVLIRSSSAIGYSDDDFDAAGAALRADNLHDEPP